MAEPPPPGPPVEAEAIPPAVAEPVVRRKNVARLSLVWIVPIVTALVGASLLLTHWLRSGPRLEIEFRTAEGLEAGKTQVRYKEVVIGRVESVSLGPERAHVLVEVQLDRSAASVAVQDTHFWVVRPRIGTAGVSGLGTLLSGAYIGVDAGTSSEPRRHFVGLEAPPFVLRGEPGRSFSLRATDLGSLEVGSPVYYRRARVGRVVGYTLDPTSDELVVQVFVEAPYDPLVTAQVRFWNASGLDLQLTASGLSLNAQTITSVLVGGIAFERLPGSEGATPAVPGTRFYLYSDKRSAMAPPDGPALTVRMVYPQSVRGLAVGAPVDFLGVEIGTVRALTPRYDPALRRYPMEVTADLYPMRLGKVRETMVPGSPVGDTQADIRFLRMLVDHGMRAQLRTGNLLTGQQYVALDFDPKAAHATLDVSNGVPSVPTQPGTLNELQPQIAEIVARLSKVPFEDIARDLRSTLRAARSAIAQLTPEAQRTLAGVERTLTGVQQSLQRLDRNLLDPSAPVQRQVEDTMVELQRAAQALRALGEYLQRHPESMLRGKPADAPLGSDAMEKTR